MRKTYKLNKCEGQMEKVGGRGREAEGRTKEQNNGNKRRKVIRKEIEKEHKEREAGKMDKDKRRKKE